MKKKILVFTLITALMLCLVACGNGLSTPEPMESDANSSEKEELKPDTPEASEGVEPDTSEEDDESIKSGSYTLPCGMEIQFFNSVRNDVTGNWRRAATSDSFAPADYALEYYNQMFSSDDEIHSIWNATLGTNTRITVAFGMLYVDTLEYVKGEEHDASLMFSGAVLDSRVIDIATGEEVEE